MDDDSIFEKTLPLETNAVERKMPVPSSIALPTAHQPLPWRILMKIAGPQSGDLGLEIKDKILIGRSETMGSAPPDVDLAPYGGSSQLGVSRRHAQIVRFEDDLYIEDLGSTNGTRLNNFILEPHKRYALTDGDELQIGIMRIVLRFVRAPHMSQARV